MLVSFYSWPVELNEPKQTIKQLLLEVTMTFGDYIIQYQSLLHILSILIMPELFHVNLAIATTLNKVLLHTNDTL